MGGNVLVLWIGGFPGTLILATEVWVVGCLAVLVSGFGVVFVSVVAGICALFTWEGFSWCLCFLGLHNIRLLSGVILVFVGLVSGFGCCLGWAGTSGRLFGCVDFLVRSILCGWDGAGLRVWGWLVIWYFLVRVVCTYIGCFGVFLD